MVGYDIITNKKYQETVPGHTMMFGFTPVKVEYEVADIHDGQITGMTPDGQERFFNVPEDPEVGAKLVQEFQDNAAKGGDQFWIITVVYAPRMVGKKWSALTTLSHTLLLVGAELDPCPIRCSPPSLLSCLVFALLLRVGWPICWWSRSRRASRESKRGSLEMREASWKGEGREGGGERSGGSSRGRSEGYRTDVWRGELEVRDVSMEGSCEETSEWSAAVVVARGFVFLSLLAGHHSPHSRLLLPFPPLSLSPSSASPSSSFSSSSSLRRSVSALYVVSLPCCAVNLGTPHLLTSASSSSVLSSSSTTSLRCACEMCHRVDEAHRPYNRCLYSTLISCHCSLDSALTSRFSSS